MLIRSHMWGIVPQLQKAETPCNVPQSAGNYVTLCILSHELLQHCTYCQKACNLSPFAEDSGHLEDRGNAQGGAMQTEESDTDAHSEDLQRFTTNAQAAVVSKSQHTSVHVLQ